MMKNKRLPPTGQSFFVAVGQEFQVFIRLESYFPGLPLQNNLAGFSGSHCSKTFFVVGEIHAVSDDW